MYVSVRLLNGFNKPLTYKVPDLYQNDKCVLGSFVSVPLQNRVEIAQIYQVFTNLPKDIADAKYAIKEFIKYEPFPKDDSYLDFVNKLSDYYCLDQIHFLHKVHTFLKKNKTVEEFIETNEYKQIGLDTIKLTDEQEVVVNTVIPQIGKNIYYPALLHGVTGSGKTEIYKKLIWENYFQKKLTVLLLPEVGLAVNFQNLLKAQILNGPKIYGFHSSTGQPEKNDLWQALINEQPIVIVGVHMPLYLPLPKLGLIIIDEEHESGFQDRNHPKINTKEAALLKAQICKIPIILGSATPSISSFYNVEHKDWHLFELKNRYSGAFPKINLVKLNDSLKKKNFWISSELEYKIKQQISLKKQVILFINRRGYSFFVQCKTCSFIPMCNQCSVSLTVHSDKLICHYCNFRSENIDVCSSCKSDKLIKKGIGTQQIITILNKIAPNAKVAQADLDSTVNKKKWEATIKDFKSGNIDILVGTQLITKGYHFPNVSLVGVLWADINLNIPFYNSAETALSQIIQVAGRAGREHKDSEVVIQTLQEHPIFRYISEVSYKDFYNYELQNRVKVNYPPIIRFAEIELKNKNKEVLESEANLLADYLIDLAQDRAIILGPAAPPIEMIKGISSQKIYIKSKNYGFILALYKKINHKNFKSKIYFTPNPMS